MHSKKQKPTMKQHISDIETYAEKSGDTAACHDLAVAWANWTGTLEQWMLLRQEAPAAEPPRHLGRSRPPKLVTKPLVDRPRLLAGHHPDIPDGLGIVEQLWWTALAMTRRIAKATRQLRPDRPATVARLREAQYTP